MATTITGLEALTKFEIQQRSHTFIRGEDRSLLFECDLKGVYESLIKSRYANRIFLVVAEYDHIENFDLLHSAMKSCSWSELLPKNHKIVVDATSISSLLESVPSIQSVGAKALYECISVQPGIDQDEIHIELLLKKNRLSILLDITGEALHKRGYRRSANEAPIKETLAAGLVTLAGYRGGIPLYDYFAGSGTIAIEAAMIARNIAPGLFRSYRIEVLPWHHEDLAEEIRDLCEKEIIPAESCPQIFASDIDPDMQDIAYANARRAGVSDSIIWRVGGFEDLSRDDLSAQERIFFVSNPPYGDRMDLSDDLRADIITFTMHQRTRGGIIMANESVHAALHRSSCKNRKFQQGGTLAYFYSK